MKKIDLLKNIPIFLRDCPEHMVLKSNFLTSILNNTQKYFCPDCYSPLYHVDNNSEYVCPNHFCENDSLYHNNIPDKKIHMDKNTGEIFLKETTSLPAISKESIVVILKSMPNIVCKHCGHAFINDGEKILCSNKKCAISNPQTDVKYYIDVEYFVNRLNKLNEGTINDLLNLPNKNDRICILKKLPHIFQTYNKSLSSIPKSEPLCPKCFHKLISHPQDPDKLICSNQYCLNKQYYDVDKKIVSSGQDCIIFYEDVRKYFTGGENTIYCKSCNHAINVAINGDLYCSNDCCKNNVKINIKIL